MRALRYHRHGDSYRLQADQVPPREPGPGEVRIRVAFCGICGSDLGRYRRLTAVGQSEPADFGEISPAGGHELSGVADLAGPDVPRSWPGGPAVLGSRVVANPLVGCGHCGECRHGHWNTCRNPGLRAVIGVHRDGGFADQVCVPFDHLVPVPAGLAALDVAALTEPLAVARHALNVAGPAADGAALVVGDGPVALLIVHALRAAGHGQVTILGRHSGRLAAARALGATPGPADAKEIDTRFGIIFQAASSRAALDTALRLLEIGGKAICVGYIGDALSGLDAAAYNSLISRHQSLRASFGYNQEEFAAAADYAAAHQGDLRALITHVVSLSRAVDDGFAALLAAGKQAVKVLVAPGRDSS